MLVMALKGTLLITQEHEEGRKLAMGSKYFKAKRLLLIKLTYT